MVYDYQKGLYFLARAVHHRLENWNLFSIVNSTTLYPGPFVCLYCFLGKETELDYIVEINRHRLT